MSGELTVRREGSLTTLTLSQPEKLNAFSAALVEALIAAVEVARSDGTRLCVFAGAGKGFSGGFDFSGLDRQSDGDLALRFLRIEMLLDAVHHAPFQTLGLAHGPCFGAAADLVAVCRHRVAAPDARFRMPGLRFGVTLGTGRLARTIGGEAARALLETSKVFLADEALATGFVHAVTPAHEWPSAIERVHGNAEALSPAAALSLFGQSTEDRRDSDMAALARSVAEPGLGARIRAFYEAAKRRP